MENLLVVPKGAAAVFEIGLWPVCLDRRKKLLKCKTNSLSKDFTLNIVKNDNTFSQLSEDVRYRRRSGSKWISRLFFVHISTNFCHKHSMDLQTAAVLCGLIVCMFSSPLLGVCGCDVRYSSFISLHCAPRHSAPSVFYAVRGPSATTNNHAIIICANERRSANKNCLEQPRCSLEPLTSSLVTLFFRE